MKGRPLRVLHIGNIANNAYNNAKIQRTHGIDADVLCYDYYHIMATPEWEDAELSAQVDSSLPDWWQTKLRGFQRPDWFVQGPTSLCVSYLVARAKGQRFLSKLRRWGLEGAYWDLLEDKAKQVGSSRFPAKSWMTRSFSTYILSLYRRSGPYISSIDPWKTISQRLISPIKSLRSRVFVPLIVAATAAPPRMAGASILTSIWVWQRKLRSLPSIYVREFFLDERTEEAILLDFSLLKIIWNIFSIVLRSMLELAVYFLFFPVRLSESSGNVILMTERECKTIADGLVARFRQQEPGISEPIWTEFHRYLVAHALRFSPVLAHYDIIQGYSIDGIIPLSNGVSAFSAYEHGTLRDIPFENTWLGLVCRIVYRNAPSIFITNSDVLESANRLKLDKEKTCFLPHAFDDLRLDVFRKTNHEIVPDPDIVHFFCPSRQHWRDQNQSLTKGSDLMLRAAAKVAAEGHNFRLILVEWGVDIDASKALIAELNLEGFVSWVPPMDKRSLWRQYCKCHAVLDQFSLPALGGVGFEALALGRRLITRIDIDQLQIFFGYAPPVLPAASIDQIASSIRAVILDPEDHAQTGASGRRWIENYHSARRIVGLQAREYRVLLERRSAEFVVSRL
jgi:glycosyltransferase involved in cell wall biosynthesis